MAKTNNFIELNGKRYDALTGSFLGVGTQVVATKPTHAVPKATPHHGVFMDGVKPSKTAAVPAHKPVATHLHHSQPIAAHKPQHAKTLRRDIVKPPTIKPQKPLKVQTPTDIVQYKPGVLTVKPKLSSDIIDPARATRSLDIPRSQQVERFRKQPAPRPANHISPLTPTRPVQRPVDTFNIARQPARVAPRQASQTRTTNDEDIFEQAIAYARSHEQPKPQTLSHKKTKRANRRAKKLVGVLASVLMVAFLGGFIFWQNRADIELQLASARSGVPASLPTYKPSGYAVKGFTYSPGTVTIGYGSGSGDFNVVQKSSNWDSETLLQNYVATSGQAYNAYQAAGRTVYVYGNGNATWVNGGIWYQVNDNGVLSKDQLINLATSM